MTVVGEFQLNSNCTCIARYCIIYIDVHVSLAKEIPSGSVRNDM